MADMYLDDFTAYPIGVRRNEQRDALLAQIRDAARKVASCDVDGVGDTYRAEAENQLVRLVAQLGPTDRWAERGGRIVVCLEDSPVGPAAVTVETIPSQTVVRVLRSLRHD